MKFLGEYNFETAKAYQEKLEAEEIYPKVEEVGGYFGASWATMGTLHPRIRLYVEDTDYERANALIKDVEQGFIKKLEVDGKEADRVMTTIGMAIVLSLITGAILYLVCNYR